MKDFFKWLFDYDKPKPKVEKPKCEHDFYFFGNRTACRCLKCGQEWYLQPYNSINNDQQKEPKENFK